MAAGAFEELAKEKEGLERAAGEEVKEKAALGAAGVNAVGSEKALVEEGVKALVLEAGETRAAKGLALAAEGLGAELSKLNPVLNGDCGGRLAHELGGRREEAGSLLMELLPEGLQLGQKERDSLHPCEQVILESCKGHQVSLRVRTKLEPATHFRPARAAAGAAMKTPSAFCRN